MLDICSAIRRLAPGPTATIVITAATPINDPEHGQGRTHLVHPQGLERYFYGRRNIEHRYFNLESDPPSLLSDDQLPVKQIF